METIHTITYVAFDGTKFTNQKNCENYENDCIFKMLNNVGIRFFGKNFIPCTDATESVDAEYIYFPENEKAYDLYSKFCDSDAKLTFVDYVGEGLYYFDSNCHGFYSVEKEVEKYKM